jgi:hypothetical protein
MQGKVREDEVLACCGEREGFFISEHRESLDAAKATRLAQVQHFLRRVTLQQSFDTAAALKTSQQRTVCAPDFGGDWEHS